MAFETWPPTLADLKVDAQIDPEDTRDDAALQVTLDAAVSFVERVHIGRYTFDGEPTDLLPAPPYDARLGTARLAHRWHWRRRSPDALVVAGELGSARIPSFDPDIERMLRIGRYALPVIA
jgi:hypothetical protein